MLFFCIFDLQPCAFTGAKYIMFFGTVFLQGLVIIKEIPSTLTLGTMQLWGAKSLVSLLHRQSLSCAACLPLGCLKGDQGLLGCHHVALVQI